MPQGASQVRPIHDGRAIAFPGWLQTPGLLHGTTTRAALPEPRRQDLFEIVAELRASGVLPDRLTFGGDQVHGEEVAVVTVPIAFGHHPPGFRWNAAAQTGEFAETDALVTSIPGVVLLIRTADCLPVLLMDRPTRLVGIAHCGWKGTLAGLAAKTARAMQELGAPPQRLEAWIGPGICAAHYAVGAERVRLFQERFPPESVSPDGVRLDLARLARRQLEETGLLPDRIFDSGQCTLDDPERYYSYRGAGGETGRMISFIGFDPESE